MLILSKNSHKNCALYKFLSLQCVPLATSPKPLTSKYSFRLVKNIQIEYIL